MPSCLRQAHHYAPQLPSTMPRQGATKGKYRSEQGATLPSCGHLLPPLCMHSSLSHRSPPRYCHHVEHHSNMTGHRHTREASLQNLVPDFGIIQKGFCVTFQAVQQREARLAKVCDQHLRLQHPDIAQKISAMVFEENCHY